MLNQIVTITINGVHITVYEQMHGFQTQYGLSHKGFATLPEALCFFYESIDHALTLAGLVEDTEHEDN